MMGHRQNLSWGGNDFFRPRSRSGVRVKLKRRLLKRERQEARTMLGVVYRNGEAYTE